VQFLSVFCTSLSSQQQNQVSQFQVASFTQIAMSKAKLCSICPGSCVQPLVLLVPTFALMSCFFAVGVVVAAFDVAKARKSGRLGAPIREHLLEASDVAGAVAADRRSSLRQQVTAFCTRIFRSLIETCSSYALIPCTFVFVVNVRPSSFTHAESSDRAMIVMLPIMALLFRALVIRQRVVDLTSADQKLLITSSIFSCLIVAVLSVYFEQVGELRQSNPSFASETQPQYVAFALLVVQVITQTIIRGRSTEASIYDKMTLNFLSASSRSPSTRFPFDELETRLMMSFIKSTSCSGAIAAAKFLILNYVAISQIAIVAVGIASSGAISLASVQASSFVIGSIPIFTSGVLLLYNTCKVAAFVWAKCFRVKKAEQRLSEMESQF
jgi:hypothetical protein